MLVVTPPLALIIVVRSFLPGRAERLYDRISRIWARCALRVSGARVDAFGLEHVAPDRPQILLANHASWYDVLALATILPKRYRFVGKVELARVPLWGRAWLAAGHIPIDRSNTERAIESLDRAARMVRADNSSIIIFPEGTRSAAGELLPFKKGGFMLAIRAGIELVPVGISGTRAILPKGGWRVRSGRIIVRFGEPIPAAGYQPEARDELLLRARTAMQRLIDASATEPDEANVRNTQRPRT
jgi:1-acyl-sn-glycerol-3-phosphate acyltransferase